MAREDKEGSIRLSSKFGVNPSIEVCFVCGEDIGVVLCGYIKGDVEAPKKMVVNRTPCKNCCELMQLGIVMISVKDGEQSEDNPKRTGGWVVVKDEAIKKVVSEEVFEKMVKARMVFVEDSIWDALGLPR
jgi:hypothetical protein